MVKDFVAVQYLSNMCEVTKHPYLFNSSFLASSTSGSGRNFLWASNAQVTSGVPSHLPSLLQARQMDLRAQLWDDFSSRMIDPSVLL